MQTWRNSNVIKIPNGEYCFFGIKTYFKKLDLKALCPNNIIKLRVNIDGLPLCKSTSAQFWPILGLIVTSHKIPPFAIACYYGSSKPVCIQQFLKDFINEVNELISNGYKQDFQFNLAHFNCDAPARAFIKCIKNHNSYYGCEKCLQKRTVIDGHVKFLKIESPLRTDDLFFSHFQEQHHTTKTPLFENQTLFRSFIFKLQTNFN